METTHGKLASLLRRAARRDDPEDSLRAVTEMRQELQRLEAEHVATALREGSSWSRIASALGITKQAAHKRHRRTALDPATQGPGRRGQPKVLVTKPARRAMQLAREEAESLGQTDVGSEHLLLGILRCHDDPAVRALEALGVSLDTARAVAEPTIVRSPSPRRPWSRARPRGGVSPHARHVLERSLGETIVRGEGHIGLEHLLLGLLREEEGGAARTLDRLGVSLAEVRRVLTPAD